MPGLKAENKKRILIVIFIIVIVCVVIASALDPRMQISRYTLTFDNLPDGWDKTTVAVIADTHGSYISDGETALLTALEEEQPEYIFCLGDMLNEKNPDFETFRKAMENFVKIAPVYVVSGNHDRWTKWEGSYFSYYRKFCKVCEEAGAIVLDDAECTLVRNNDSIRLIGFADPDFWTADPEPGCVSEQESALPGSENFDILLFHRANLFPEVAGKNYDLVLSGHLHGGLVRLPLYGPLFKKLPVGETTYAGGIYELSGTVLVSSRGLGNNMSIPRIFNRPQLVFITLEK